MPDDFQIEQQDRELNPIDYLLTIYRRKWALIIMVVVVAGIATIASLRMPKMYQARTVIEISQRPQLSDLAYDWRYMDPYFLNTEIALIKSRTLNYKVVNELGLAYEVTEASPGLGNAIKKLDVLEGAKESTVTIRFRDKKEYFVDFNGNRIGYGKVGEEFEGEFGILLIQTDSASRGGKIEVEVKDIDREVTGLLSGIAVKSIPDVNMVELIITGRDPEKIKIFANTLADEYVTQSLEDKRLQASSTRRFIEEQLERIRKNLDETGRELMDFKREEGIIDISTETNRRISIMSSLENKILEETIDRQIKRRELNELRRRAEKLGSVPSDAGGNSDVDFSFFAEETKIRAIDDRIMNLQNERTKLMVTHTSGHPEVRKIDGEIARLNDEMALELDRILEEGNLATEVSLADGNIDYLDGTYNDYYNYLSDIPEKELELNRLTRKYQVNESIYFSLMEKLQEAQIRESMENADIRVIDYAITPRKPTSPNHIKNISIGLALGLILGLGLVFILEFADTTLSTVEEVEKLYHYPVVGVIPLPEGLKGVPDKRDKTGVDRSIYTVTLDRPKSPISESFRSLRTAVLAAAVDKEKYSLMVTSSSLSEGKSNTITNLAIVLAQTGKKIVLVDSDLRRSVLYKAFNQEKTPGLSELLLGEAKLKDCLRPTDQEGLMLIAAGDQPPNPSELLGSNKMISLVNNLHKKFDFVLFDAPPVLAVTDPLILGGITDGTLFIITAANTDRKAAKRALQILKQTNPHIIGIVFNQVKLDRSLGGYGYKYYAQYYSSYDNDDV